MINSFFQFRPVGQGAFYSGQLSYRRFKNFSFVYDCGAIGEDDILIHEIEDFKLTLHSDTLNMLILSHLDDDHVNGVKSLLENLKCKRIYLPYLTPIERLYVSISQGPKDVKDLDVYLDFITDPAAHLLSFDSSKIEKIVFIKGNSEDKYTPSDLKPINPETDNDNEFDDRLEEVPENEFTSEMKQLKNSHKVKIDFKKGNNSVMALNIWEFYFYNEPAKLSRITELEQAIDNIYNIQVGEELTQEQLVEILNQRDNLKLLRIKFRSFFRSTNKTGLVVQHKPLNFKNSFLHTNLVDYHFTHYFSHVHSSPNHLFSNQHKHRNTACITLLTGDICLKQIENSLYIKDNLKNVNVFQVPHHGSSTGWEPEFLNNLNPRGRTSAVINFGFGNKYGHPKPNVLRDLDCESFPIRFCNQFEDFKYYIRLKL
jgi:hypothetical protein